VQANPHTRLKKQVFYRQDYLDEFEAIWETQAKYYPVLTPALKEEIRDVVIFYQRKLKSQRGLVSFCEFESKEVEVEKDGKKVTKTIGYKVTPKSSPLFQEFKIWQILHNLKLRNKQTKKTLFLDDDTKKQLFDELNIKGNFTGNKIMEIVGYNPKEWEISHAAIDGNHTSKALYEAYLKIAEMEGCNISALLQTKADSDINLAELTIKASELNKRVKQILESLNIRSEILEFNAELEGKAFERQLSYQLWHLLYSYEDDDSVSGNERLYEQLRKKFGFKREHAQILANVNLLQNYGSLSAKAMRKIFPFIKENKYSDACALAGYNHSSSLTKQENENRPLKDKLTLLPKNSLRNPVVEKILNQMVNVVNALIDDPTFGKPDEIRIELARELKKNAKEREKMTKDITEAKTKHDKIRKLLIDEFGIKNPTHNDIIRYKLYDELRINGYKTLYSDTYIPHEKLFSKDFDIEHIIPKALLFDDNFSNKTLCKRQENLDKADKTAYDFVESFGKESFEAYVNRVEMMYKAKDGAISKAKYKKLLMKASEIGDGFIERDLRETQYIAKKARQMLLEINRTVVATTGEVTNRLREDWGLINIMQELNFEKYKQLGLTEKIEKTDGSLQERIVDWTKRNDHRHHAMDALAVAFTKHSYIQYLNYLNARKDETHKYHENIIGIEQKELEWVIDNKGQRKRKFKLPLPNFRSEAKKQLETILVSYKAKNKIATKNINRHKIATGEKQKMELTPRGQLHKETVYGKIQQYIVKEEKISSKFDKETIQKVASQQYREALLLRLAAFDNDPKKAFTGKNSLNKNPIYLDAEKTVVMPEKVKVAWLEENYTIRKDITPDLKIDKVVDTKIRVILQNRLNEFKGNAKEAFSSLDKTPIWFNKEKGISIKRVTISGVSNAEALHYKRNHLGELILDANGDKIPADFVSTGNNHHVAIYRDKEGKLQEKVVSFYEAVTYRNQGLPIIDKTYNHDLGWQFLFTMKQNEYFVFPSDNFNPSEIDLLDPENKKLISPHLYRVQKLATKNYFFRHHLETDVKERKELEGLAYKPQLGLKAIQNIVKVRVNHIGQIIKVGEY
jgi:CRISPR-associated endonuclease Csn1